MRKTIKLALLSIITCSLFIFTGGCWSANEINSLALVMGVGIDTVTNDDSPSEIEVTIQLANGKAMKPEESSGSGDTEAYRNMSERGKSVQSALHRFESKLSRELYTGHMQLVVVSQDTAKAGLSKLLDYFYRASDARFSMPLIVAEGKAADLLSADSGAEPLPVTRLSNLMNTQRLDVMVQRTTMTDFLCEMLNGYTAPTLPLYTLDEDNNATLNGTAVFKDDKMIGSLTPTQTLSRMAIKNEYTGGIIECVLPNGEVEIFEIVKATAKRSVHFESGKFWIEMEHFVSCRATDTDELGDISSSDGRHRAEELVRTTALEQLEDITAAAKAMNADVFKFGEDIFRRYPRESKELMANWDSEFANFEIRYEVHVTMFSTGAVTQEIQARTEKK